MKLPVLAMVLLSASFQTDSNSQTKHAKTVADVEASFARTSRESNTVNAFQKFLAEDAVLFRKGEAVNGKALWQDRKPDSTLLNWWPVVADASSAGDLGYTTGPYESFNHRRDKMPSGNGFYSTIWKKQKDGSWKIKLDLGVRLQAVQTMPTKLIIVESAEAKATDAKPIKSVDADYNSILTAQGVSFEENFLAADFRLHRPLVGAAVNETRTIKKSEEGVSFQFQQIDGEASRSNDLAYAYGNVVRIDKLGERKANYLRVWKNEDGKWRVVLDVVTEG